MNQTLNRAITWAIALLLLQSCTTTRDSPATGGDGIKLSQPIRKSPADEREYRYLRLDNELQVVLISDPQADKSAAAMAVFRGNYSDPDQYPGLAHFLEHMLFIGTDKYPEPDGYQQFIQGHGGSSNAYTSTDHTNYFFDIQPEYFREGFDRFAQFFISPSFDPTYVDREKNAVDSEYRLRIKEDSWRGFMASKKTVNPAHPAGKFNIGTLESLDETVHGALLEFFENEYSANQMALVVLDREPLDTLQSWVVPTVLAVENRDLEPYTVPEPLHLEGQLPAVLTHQSLKQNYAVVYNFPVPHLDEHYRKKPGHYLSNLLGHEGEGSLHRTLIERGWITSLASGRQNMDDKVSMMAVDISLTPEGREHIPEITDMLFAYIDLLRKEEPAEWRYAEQATVANLAFRFQEKAPAINTVNALSQRLKDFPADDLLTHGYLMEEFDADLIKSYLAYLTPENVMMEIIGPDVETTEVEEYFQVGYTLEYKPVPRQGSDASGLHQPEINAFLPEDLTVGTDDGQEPVVAYEDDTMRIWLDVDNEFRVPRATVNVSLRSEKGLVGLEDVVLAGLYRRIVIDDLNTLSYPALLAGVSYSLATPPKGFRLTTGGYNDKQLVLLDAVLERVMNLKMSKDRFEVLKADTLRGMRNFRSNLPYQQTRSAMNDVLLSSSWSPEEQATFLETVDLDTLDRWRRNKLADVDVLALVHGNVSSEDADGLRKVLSKHLKLSDVSIQTPQVREIDRMLLDEVPIDHNDSSMILTVMDDDDSFASRAKSSLATQLLRSAYFSSLRTEQQLGYAVAVMAAPVYYRGTVTFLVQSPNTPVDTLETKTIEFMDAQIEAIKQMPPGMFAEYQSGLISSLTETDKNLGQRSLRYWADLDREVETFDSNHQVAEAVGALTHGDMIEFLQELRAKLDTKRLLVFNRGRFDSAPSRGVEP